ncbi:CU044_2847 family protein [Streptomyces sp. NPDC051597]|uniref:CU044_2847 family protein n=1 Tax=Streptomyces sp. NPDC051597 TaxID=3155049 RepID=UPI00343F53D5
MPLDGGGSILVQADPVEASAGPVAAGRVSEAIRDLPQSLESVIAPVAGMARAVLDEFRRVRPDGVEVEFGVDLAAQAGAVIAKSETACHLKVTVTWNAAANANANATGAADGGESAN